MGREDADSDNSQSPTHSEPYRNSILYGSVFFVMCMIRKIPCGISRHNMV